MTMRGVSLTCAGITVGLLVLQSGALLPPDRSASDATTAVAPGIGDALALHRAYERWAARQASLGGDRTVVLPLTSSRGGPAQISGAGGRVTLDVTDGALSATVHGLPDAAAFDLWLIRARAAAWRVPDGQDDAVRIGRLTARDDVATLTARLDRGTLHAAGLDRVVVAPAGRDPLDSGVLFASPTLFQRMYHADARAGSGRHALAAPFRGVIPLPAHAQAGGATSLDELVARGERIFFEETFAGNGRTCGTCHPATNNFTIDPAFIATLPPDDPLFVAELRPALSRNFENPGLMRERGLILENLDGFGNLARKFVMRGVPHTLALSTSMTPGFALFSPGFVPPGPAAATGWGGDGSPGTGTLREFATGAVRQHFTKRLRRLEGVDFRLPTSEELDALEAFQLSLGRQDELHLASMRLKGALPEAGRQLFLGSAQCNVCHENAGANIAVPLVPGQPPVVLNANFDTGIEDVLQATSPGRARPRDGGFGLRAAAGGFGDATFNTPPLVEAADTPPFFHNNLFDTIEEAVRFYTTDTFRDSNAAALLRQFTGQDIVLDENGVVAVAAFLRAINALENIRSATALGTRAKAARTLRQARPVLDVSRAEIGDAIRVLRDANLHPFAVVYLTIAQELVDRARATGDRTLRNLLIDGAAVYQALARVALI